MTPWELTRIEVPLSLATSGEDGSINSVPVHSEASEAAWAQAAQLAREGWELVSSVPLVASHEFEGDVGVGSSFTSGYVLLFRRSVDN